MAARQQPGPISWPRENCFLAPAAATNNPSIFEQKSICHVVLHVCNPTRMSVAYFCYTLCLLRNGLFGEVTTLRLYYVNDVNVEAQTLHLLLLPSREVFPVAPLPRLDPCSPQTRGMF